MPASDLDFALIRYSGPTFTVNTTNDTVDVNPGDGVALDAQGNTSLRAAIMEANALAGFNQIVLPAGTYGVSIFGPDEDAAATGDLDVADGLAIVGAGAGQTVIDGLGMNRAFEILPGVTASIRHVMITRGDDTSTDVDGVGGGILNTGMLTVEDSILTANHSGLLGGAIDNYGSTASLTVVRSTLSNNTAQFSGEGNSGRGAGVHNLGGTVRIFESTLFGNVATELGGAIYSSGGVVELTNTTISGNRAHGIDPFVGGGGGIYAANTSLSLTNVTITANSSTADGGGVYRANGTSAVFLNTIVVGNTLHSGSPSDVYGSVTSLGHNLIGVVSGSFGFSTAQGDKFGTTTSPLDPRVAALADNGGLTLTHALLPGSPALDAGANAGAPPTDQRGSSRPVNGTVDIGSFESPGTYLTVTISPEVVNESSGPRAATALVSRGNTSGNLTVTLTSSDTSEAQIVSSVVIPDGQNSVSVPIDAIDDTILDGPQTVTITATATGYSDGSDTLQVRDIEILTLSFDPTSIAVGESTVGTLTRGNTDVENEVAVTLSHGDSSEFGLPSSVIIPAGQQRTTVTVTTSDNGIVEGTRPIVVRASAAGYFGDTDTVELREDDVVAIAVGADGDASDTDRNGTFDAAAATGTRIETEVFTFEEKRGIFEFDLSGQDLSRISAASLTFRAGSMSYPRDAETLTIEVYGYTADGVISAGDALLGTKIGELVLPTMGGLGRRAVPLDASFLESLPSGSFVGLATRMVSTGNVTVYASEATYVPLTDRPFLQLLIAPNAPPAASDDAYATDEDAPITVAAGAGVLANDTDAEGSPLAAALVSGPARGTLTFNSDGSFTYTPEADFNGTDSFTYQANDGEDNSNIATVSISVAAVNDPPVARTLTVATNEDRPVSGQAATDVDADALTFALSTGPSNGSVTFATDGTFTYTPDSGFVGTDSFSFTANDGTTSSTEGTITVDVAPANNPPVAADDTYATDEESPLTGAAPGVLANDGDADGDPLTAVLVSGPSHGALTLNADGSFVYTPDANFNGTDSFTYLANDGTDDGNVATVTLTVAAVDDTSRAVADGFATDSNRDGAFSTVDTSSRTIRVRLYPDSTAWPPEDRGLFEFSVAGLVDGGIAVESAVLRVRTAGDFGFNTKTLDVYAYAGDGLITSEHAAGATTRVGSFTVPDNASSTFLVPLDAAVIESIAQSGNYVGLQLRITAVSRDAEAYGVSIYSTEGAGSSTDWRPALILGTTGAPAPALAVSLDRSTAAENAGAAVVTGTVTRLNADPSVPLVVSISSSDPTEAVPASQTVTIPAGQTSVTFTIDAVDDSELDGTRIVTFTASAADYVAGTASLQVTDHETLTITVADSIISEAAGPGATTGTVTRSNTDIGQPLTVSLRSLNTGAVTVPAEVVIAAGETSAIFAVDAVDDEIVDGTTLTRIQASAAGYVTGEVDIRVTDDDGGRIRPGNILIATEDRYVREYKPDGTLIQTFSIINQGSDLLDLVVNAAGDIEVMNGGAVLTTIDVETGTTQNHTAPNWGTSGPGWSGGIARYGQFIFVADAKNTDPVTGQQTPAGVVRFDTANGYATTRIDMDLNDVADVAIGHDGLLYALNDYHVRVYNPDTLQKVRDLSLQFMTHHALAVNAAGEIYATAMGDAIYKYDSTGTLIEGLVTGYPVKDIDLDGNGRIVASARSTSISRSYVVITDEGFQTITAFTPTSDLDLFVAFAGPDYAASPHISTSATPAVYTEGDLSVAVDPNLLLTDDGDRITRAVVRITGNHRPAEDRLSFASGNGISGSFNTTTGTLTMTGAASVAAYRTALRSVRYYNLSNGPDEAERTITFTAADEGWSGSAEQTVQVVSVDDGPPVGQADSHTVSEDGVLTVPVTTSTRLIMTSDPGEWVGQGKSYNLTSGTFSVRLQYGTNGVSLKYQGSTSSDYWDLTFRAPTGESLQVGTYRGANRSGSSGSATLNVSGQGRGNNVNLGYFTVHQVAYNASGQLIRFAADFVQHSEAQLPALRGTIDYRATYNTVSGVLKNDTDPDGDRLTAVLVAGPASGALTLNGDGTFTYTPAANFHGTDSFTYKANDGTSDSGVTTVTINVASVNDPPIANTLTVGTDTGEPVSGQAATDADSDPLTFTLTSRPGNGLVTFAPDGTFTYTPNAGFNGTDSFSFTSSDGTATSSEGTITVDVTPENDPPLAGDDAYATDEDTALAIAAPGILANDTDADGDSLTAVLVGGPSNGTLALSADGSFTYTPALNFNGSDSFTYRADDGLETSAIATVTISVAPVNDAPVAVPDSATTNYETAVTVSVLANDTDAEGDAISILDVVQPLNGSVIINTDNTLTYTPDAKFFGEDSFTYRASDGAAASDPATVTIKVLIPAPAVTGISEDTGASSTDGVTEDTTLVVLGTAVPNSTVKVFHDGISIGTVNADGAGNWSFDYTAVVLSNRTHRFTAAIVDGSTTGPLSPEFLALVQAPGAAPLDPTFGQGGLVTTNFQGPSADSIADLTLLQPDGKILAVATTENAIGARDIALTRFHADGTLDTAFGSSGKAVLDFGGADRASGLALDAAGCIVVVGNRVTDPRSRSDVAVARFLADGTLDTSFGDNGVVVTVLSNGLNFTAGVEIDASGRIVVAATADGTFSTDRNVAVVRYLESGELDLSFGGTGIVTADIRASSDNDFAQAVRIDSAGQIVVLATSNNDFAFVKYSDSGAVNGILIANVGGGFATTDRAQDFVIDAQGDYVAVGQSNNRLAVIRFRSSGGLDTSFAGDGSFSTTWHGGLGETATGVIIDSFGNIVVAGRAEESSFSTDFGLLRLTPDGALDTSFNGTGKLTVDFGNTADGGGSLALDDSGRILVGGATRIGTPLSDLALVRVNFDGTFDETFGTGGKLASDLQGHAHDFGRDAVLQADGKIIALGTQNLEGSNSDMSLARYNTDGSLDTAFGFGGLLVTDFFGGDDHGVSVTLDQAGRILALAQSNNAIAIARYLTDGTLDPTFGSGGLLTLQPWSTSLPESIAVDAAGRIVIGGRAFDSTSTIGTDFAVVRLNSDGTLDSSFGSGGKATANFGGRFENAADMVIDANGRIILVGNVEPQTGGFSARDIAVAVFTPEGTLDVSFSSDGILTTDISGAADFGDAVAVDDSGRILVGGNATNARGIRDFVLVRYNPDETLDQTFDGDGKLITDFNGNDFVHDLAVDSAGRIVAAGRSGPNSDVYDFSLARYDSSGRLDPSFGISGRATTDFGGTDLGQAVLIDRFDRIVVVGYSGQGATGYDFALARYDADPPAAPVVVGVSDDTGASGSDGVTSDGTLIISGTAEANSLVEVFRERVSLGTTTAKGSGDWSFDATGTALVDGTYQITATATDGAGHTSGLSPAFSVTIDTVAPAAPVVGGISDDTGASSSDGITRDNTLVIFGTATAGSTVEVFLDGANIGTSTADNSGAWSFDHSGVVLADGTYAITARAFDLAGNASGNSAEFTVVVNSMVPVANDDMYGVDEDAVLTIAAGSGILSNDTDAGGDSLFAVLATVPTHGSLPGQ